MNLTVRLQYRLGMSDECFIFIRIFKSTISTNNQSKSFNQIGTQLGFFQLEFLTTTFLFVSSWNLKTVSNHSRWQFWQMTISDYFISTDTKHIQIDRRLSFKIKITFFFLTIVCNSKLNNNYICVKWSSSLKNTNRHLWLI